MSLKPGIGADAMWEVASMHMEYNLCERNGGDVVSSLRHGPRIMPLGRYLTRKLRTYVGMEPNAPQVTLDKAQAKMQPVLEAAKQITSFPGGAQYRKNVQKNLIIDLAQGRVAGMEARVKIRKKRGNL